MKRWKALEKRVAMALGGTRVLRGADFSKSDVDVLVAGHPRLRIDCKAYARFAHHGLLREIRAKYCTDRTHVPVLVTAEPHQADPYVTIPLSFLAELLRAAYDLEGPAANREGSPQGEASG